MILAEGIDPDQKVNDPDRNGSTDADRRVIIATQQSDESRLLTGAVFVGWQGFCDPLCKTPHFSRGCINAEHLMTDRYYFETANTEHRGRVRAFSAKLQAREESKRQALINAARRKADQTEAMIRDLQKAILLLDHSIEAELDSSWIRDTSHFAFPISARALITRRDNLKATIAALSDQLPKQQQTQVAAPAA